MGMKTNLSRSELINLGFKDYENLLEYQVNLYTITVYNNSQVNISSVLHSSCEDFISFYRLHRDEIIRVYDEKSTIFKSSPRGIMVGHNRSQNIYAFDGYRDGFRLKDGWVGVTIMIDFIEKVIEKLDEICM